VTVTSVLHDGRMAIDPFGHSLYVLISAKLDAVIS
jgi:hypothetical protein